MKIGKTVRKVSSFSYNTILRFSIADTLLYVIMEASHIN